MRDSKKTERVKGMKISVSRDCRRIRILFLILAVCACMLGNTVTVDAAQNGWNRDDRGWWYQFQDGSYAKKVWLKEKGIYYAFDEEGYMITGWCRLDGTWYYFEPTGVMRTGWLQDTDGLWYYLSETGAMRTGWQEDTDGKWYYLCENGAMAADCWIDGCYVGESGAWEEDRVLQADLGAKLQSAIERMKVKYPEGSYWNHMGTAGLEDNSDMVTDIPCDHAANQLAFCNSYIMGNVLGYQCDGFARKLSDEIFGKSAMIMDYRYDYDRIKVGDYLRFSVSKDSYIANGHSVIIIEKSADRLIIGEANYGGSCRIHWGGQLTRQFLDGMYVECFTRY